MTSYVVLSGADVLALTKDKPVVIYIDGKPHTLCTDEYFEKETRCKLNNSDREGGMTNGDVIEATGLFEIVGNLSNDMLVCISIKGLVSHAFISFSKAWWDAPYKRTEG